MNNDESTGFIAVVSGLPTAIFAYTLSQTEIAIVALIVNVFLAVGLKFLDVYARIYFEQREARKLALSALATAAAATQAAANAAHAAAATATAASSPTVTPQSQEQKVEINT